MNTRRLLLATVLAGSALLVSAGAAAADPTPGSDAFSGCGGCGVISWVRGSNGVDMSGLVVVPGPVWDLYQGDMR